MKIFRFIIISNILLYILGCTQNEETLPLEGSIVGFVSLIDENGNEVNDKSNVTVTIDDLDLSATTDENGRYELKDVPSGTYNISFSKTNYGTIKRYSFQLVGGNVPTLFYSTSLYEQPDIELNNLDISYNGTNISVAGDITEVNQYRAQIFISTSPDVSYSNYEYTPGTYGFCCVPTYQLWFTIYLNNSPYKQGDTIYLVIYFINYNEDFGYYDYETDEYIYSSYKKVSNAIKFTIE